MACAAPINLNLNTMNKIIKIALSLLSLTSSLQAAEEKSSILVQVAQEGLLDLSVLNENDKNRFKWMLDFYSSVIDANGDLSSVISRNFGDKSAVVKNLKSAASLALEGNFDGSDKRRTVSYYKTVRKYGGPFFWKYKIIFDADPKSGLVLVQDFLDSMDDANRPDKVERSVVKEAFIYSILKYNSEQSEFFLKLVSRYMDLGIGSIPNEVKIVLRDRLLTNPLEFESSILNLFSNIVSADSDELLSSLSQADISKIVNSLERRDIHSGVVFEREFFGNILRESDWSQYSRVEIFLIKHYLQRKKRKQ